MRFPEFSPAFMTYTALAAVEAAEGKLMLACAYWALALTNVSYAR